eukprot:2604923-Amphidinium_carterae.1
MQTVGAKHSQKTALVQVYVKPTLVRVTKPCPIKSLKLVGMGMRLDKKGNASAVGVGSYHIGSQQVAMYVAAQFTPPTNGEGVANAIPWVAPFWAVQSVKQSDDATQVNMELAWEKVIVEGVDVQVPVLFNTVALKEGEILVKVKTDSAPVPPRKASKHT